MVLVKCSEEKRYRAFADAQARPAGRPCLIALAMSAPARARSLGTRHVRSTAIDSEKLSGQGPSAVLSYYSLPMG